jgi:hypothetical protein
LLAKDSLRDTLAASRRIRIEGCNDLQVGDTIDCFTTEKVAPKI